jgi:hypothetical protein
MLVLTINDFEVNNFPVVHFLSEHDFQDCRTDRILFSIYNVQKIFFPMLALIINGFEVKNFQVVQFCPNTIFGIMEQRIF